MSIVQCIRGHYYDDSRDIACPYCRKYESEGLSEDDFSERLTQYKALEDDDAVRTEAYGENVEENEKTIGIFEKSERNRLTAGWLVCTEGMERGASYPIYAGRNFVGRDDSMDISLRGDRGICRKRHGAVVDDPRSRRFFAVAGEGALYVNGDPLSDSREIFENDSIQAGKSTYLFVPFCKGERFWK